MATLLFVAASPALAQTAAPDPPAGIPDTGVQAIPPSTDPCSAQPNAAAGPSLSGRLAECGGVLVPPQTGPSGIEAPVPAPDPGTTPIIPPDAVPDQPANPT